MWRTAHHDIATPADIEPVTPTLTVAAARALAEPDSSPHFRSPVPNNRDESRRTPEGEDSTSPLAISRYISSNCRASYLHTGPNGSSTPLSRLTALSAIVPMDGWLAAC